MSNVRAVPEGAVGYVLAEIVGKITGTVLYLGSNEAELTQLAHELEYFLPTQKILIFPAWDTTPYDRSSPSQQVVMQRLRCLACLAEGERNVVVLTTISAIMQYIMPASALREASMRVISGSKRQAVMQILSRGGYVRRETAAEPGEFAVRGSIIDVVPADSECGYRLDFFGDDCEAIRQFSLETQRTMQVVECCQILPASEVLLGETEAQQFITNYHQHFGVPRQLDPLYEAIKEQRRYAGMEQWLPFYYPERAQIWDYFQEPPQLFARLDPEQAYKQKWEEIIASFAVRQALRAQKGLSEVQYQPIPPEEMWVSQEKLVHYLAGTNATLLSRFAEGQAEAKSMVAAFAEAGQHTAKAIAILQKYAAEARKHNRYVIIGCTDAGGIERIQQLLAQYQIDSMKLISWRAISKATVNIIHLAELSLAHSFAAPTYLFIAEQDLLGKRASRRMSSRRKLTHLMKELSSLTPGELVVHSEHGLGRFEGLHTLQVQGVLHDFLLLIYADGDKLYIPVENSNDLTRYGADGDGRLDKLGGVAWQERKAKLKAKINALAGELIKIAAARALLSAPHMVPPAELYASFCGYFPHAETEDQLRSIQDVEADLAAGRPMDRLVCGDVGFGKTEVALRAAFCGLFAEQEDGSYNRMQVAIVVPTTLLCQQHFTNISTRFASMGQQLHLRICQLSRLVSAKEAKLVTEGLESGEVDIVVGTHALLAKSIKFANLGLLIIDEEQHFGVAQKERLKQLKDSVHVLTLSATPIPRTLHMAISGMRELSLIATPPPNRLPVRTYIMPYDPAIVREACLREKARGGRIFFVAPFVSDLDEIRQRLRELLPECKAAVAHGQMPANQLDQIMQSFYDGVYDVLIATNIIESGLDVPSANTIFIHSPDHFGLAQLYQLRGRVGRGGVQAHAYLLLPERRQLTQMANRRLEVMQSLDSLGAGFQLASHDMDLRGYGNMLGDAQSGHIREVGVELYQSMLEEAIQEAKSGKQVANQGKKIEVNLGISVLLPDSYIAEVSLRIGLYRRIGDLENIQELEEFKQEMHDRFGPLPEEAEHLLQVMRIKQICKQLGISNLDAGPKGIVLTFNPTQNVGPEAIINFLKTHHQNTKLRENNKLVISKAFASAEERVGYALRILGELS